MWWKVKKTYEDDVKVVYAYSKESNQLDGEIECDKASEAFNCLKLAKGDTEKSVEKFFPHMWRLVFKENAPDEKMIAIG